MVTQQWGVDVRDRDSQALVADGARGALPMVIPLRVLGDRVLVKPDVNTNAPVQTEAGVFLAKSLAAAVTGEDPTKSVHRGTVVGVGTPRHPLYLEASTLAGKLEAYHSCPGPLGDELVEDAAQLLRDLIRRQPCVAVGDDVLFSHDAGQETVIDGEPLVILHEHELLAIVEPEGSVHG